MAHLAVHAGSAPELWAEGYELQRKIGEGGMAEVHEGVHRALGKSVAIKRLHGAALESGRSRERFEREARTLAALSSPFVVSVLDYGEDRLARPFLVMERLMGKDLRQLLREEGSLPWGRATWLMLQASWGMAEVHSAGLAHRDLKPENLFVVASKHGPEICKVIDFGLARRGSGSDELTRDGALIGTVGYMAPEQARGERARREADVHALGAILYELLCGTAPYRAESEALTLFRIMNEPARSLSERGLRVPERLETLVQRCLRKRPEERFSSAADLAKELEACLGCSAGPSLTTAPWPGSADSSARTVEDVSEERTAAAPTRRWPRATAALGGGALAALLAVGWTLLEWERGTALTSTRRADTAGDSPPRADAPPTRETSAPATRRTRSRMDRDARGTAAGAAPAAPDDRRAAPIGTTTESAGGRPAEGAEPRVSSEPFAPPRIRGPAPARSRKAAESADESSALAPDESGATAAAEGEPGELVDPSRSDPREPMRPARRLRERGYVLENPYRQAVREAQ